MKTTPFTDLHISLGAVMCDFADFNVPLEYPGGSVEEHLAVVNGVGVFDLSFMGEFWVKGPESLAFLQRLCSNDVAAVRVGQAQYNCFPNGKGGIVDDLIVYRYSEDKYMLSVNAANIDKDWQWVNANNDEGAVLENASDRMAVLAVQGPMAGAVLKRVTDVDIDGIGSYCFAVGGLAGVDNVIISNTGYTGAGGFELYFYADFAQQIWDALFDAGKEYGIRPAGLAARDSLRIEMGYCMYGHELNDSTSPVEAGLDWIVKLDGDKNLIDGELYERQLDEGTERMLVCFKLQGEGAPSKGEALTDDSGSDIGVVTSGCFSPCLNVGIGMGYVKSDYAGIGAIFNVNFSDYVVPAIVVKPPFRN